MPPIQPISAVPQSVTQSVQSAGQMGAERQRGEQQAFQEQQRATIERERIDAARTKSTTDSALQLIMGEMKGVRESKDYAALRQNRLDIARISSEDEKAAREQKGGQFQQEIALQEAQYTKIDDNETAAYEAELARIRGSMDANQEELATAGRLREERNVLTMKLNLADRSISGEIEDVGESIKEIMSRFTKQMAPLEEQLATTLPHMTAALGREFGADAYGIPDRNISESISDTIQYVVTSMGQVVNDFVNPFEDRAAIQQAVRLGKGRAGSVWAMGGELGIPSVPSWMPIAQFGAGRLSKVKGVDTKDYVHRQIATAVMDATGIEKSKRGPAVELLVKAYAAVGDSAPPAQIKKVREQFFEATGIDSAHFDTLHEAAYAVIRKRSNFYLNPLVPETFEKSDDPDKMLTLDRGVDANGNPLAPLEIPEWDATLMREVYDNDSLMGPGAFSALGFGLNGMRDFYSDISTIGEDTPKDMLRFVSEQRALYPGEPDTFMEPWEKEIQELIGAREGKKDILEELEEFGATEESGLNLARLKSLGAKLTSDEAALVKLLETRRGG